MLSFEVHPSHVPACCEAAHCVQSKSHQSFERTLDLSYNCEDIFPIDSRVRTTIRGADRDQEILRSNTNLEDGTTRESSRNE